VGIKAGDSDTVGSEGQSDIPSSVQRVTCGRTLDPHRDGVGDYGLDRAARKQPAEGHGHDEEVFRFLRRLGEFVSASCENCDRSKRKAGSDTIRLPAHETLPVRPCDPETDAASWIAHEAQG